MQNYCLLVLIVFVLSYNRSDGHHNTIRIPGGLENSKKLMMNRQTATKIDVYIRNLTIK